MNLHPWKRISTDEELLVQLAASAEPMWIFDRQTLKILAVNEPSLKSYGYTQDEFLALTVLDIRPPQEIPKFLQAVVMHRHSSVSPERWRHLTKNGDEIEVEIRSQHIVFLGREAELVCAATPGDHCVSHLDSSAGTVVAGH